MLQRLQEAAGAEDEQTFFKMFGLSKDDPPRKQEKEENKRKKKKQGGSDQDNTMESKEDVGTYDNISSKVESKRHINVNFILALPLPTVYSCRFISRFSCLNSIPYPILYVLRTSSPLNFLAHPLIDNSLRSHSSRNDQRS